MLETWKIVSSQMTTKNKYFPIKTDTSCQLKWNWSTLYLNTGVTMSCHRTSASVLTPENFNNFHNTDIKLADRRSMLDGQWPTSNCGYCKNIEDAGGYSDRMFHLTVPDMYPAELDSDITAVNIPPVILEVYFDNTCNLGCLYCNPSLSSKLADENRKFGSFEVGQVKLLPLDQKHYKSLTPLFWKWLPDNIHSLKRIHIAGGEPLLQKELDVFLSFVEDNPNPNLELNIITNLMVSKERLVSYVTKIKKLVAGRKLKRFDVLASIDCFGPQQEYVRYGLNLKTWEENFEYLLHQKWIKLSINQVVTALSIKTMPDLITKLNEWKKIRQVGHHLTGPIDVDYISAEIFGAGMFTEDFETILNLMHTDTDDERNAKKYMSGIFQAIENKKIDIDKIKQLILFLDEKDRRRSTSWRSLFPWLTVYEDIEHVV